MSDHNKVVKAKIYNCAMKNEKEIELQVLNESAEEPEVTKESDPFKYYLR